jgi:hypothetical protein
MSDEPDRSPADVLPPTANLLLGLCWVVLFAGRWILPPFLFSAGVLTPSTLSEIDDHILVRCYLALLAVTITVLILRAMRGGKAKPALVSLERNDDTVPPARSRSASSHEADRGPNTRE